MSTPSTSLAAAITTHVRRRILLVAAGFLSVVVGLSVFEILKVVASLKADVARDADALRAAIASELLVDNQVAVPLILAEANRQSTRWRVSWISYAGTGGDKEFHLVPPATWTLTAPIQKIAGRPLGVLVYRGSLISGSPQAVGVIIQMVLVALFAAAVLGALLPLAARIPQRFVLPHLRALLVAARDGALPEDSSASNFLEVDEIYREMGRLLGEKRELERRATENVKLAAVARATLMVAHDVRRPFSLLRIGLNQIESIETGSPRTRDVIKKTRDVVERALHQVNGVLADIMEVSSQSQLMTEPLSVKALLCEAIVQIFHAYSGSEISFSADFAHTCKIDVDGSKVLRVMVNIIDNARQAMKGRGTIWLTSRDVAGEDGQGFVEITIGNSGSFIPPADRERLFEAFFTKGKRGGTGLGLAIAHKVVTAHGGSIACESDQARGTAFRFSLPASAIRDDEALEFPRSARQAEAMFGARHSATVEEMERRKVEAVRKDVVLSRLRQTGENLRILVIDDELAYPEAVRALMASDDDLARIATVKDVSSFDAAVAACQGEKFNLILCDIDLGDEKGRNGFDLVALLKSMRNGARICIHSNRAEYGDLQRSALVGADAQVLKPISKSQLLELMRVSLEVPLPSRNDEIDVLDLAMACQASVPGRIDSLRNNEL